MTGSSMVTGFDATDCGVTGSDVLQPKVGDFPWDVILFVRGVV
jgi:hypothetical protein